MRVMVATSRGQGDLDDDFSFTVEGELVTLPLDICADPCCGCERSVTGLASDRATTTFTIADLPGLTRSVYADLIEDGLSRQGWISSHDGRTEFRRFIRWHIDIARQLPVGGLLRINATTKTIICIDSGPADSDAA